VFLAERCVKDIREFLLREKSVDRAKEKNEMRLCCVPAIELGQLSVQLEIATCLGRRVFYNTVCSNFTTMEIREVEVPCPGLAERVIGRKRHEPESLFAH